MNFDGLFIYFEGSDNQLVLDQFQAAVAKFAESKDFKIRVVSDQFDRTPDLSPEDISDWNLGVNVDEQHVSSPNLRHLLEFFVESAAAFDRDFVVGYVNRQKGLSEDILFIDRDSDPIVKANEVLTFL